MHQGRFSAPRRPQATPERHRPGFVLLAPRCEASVKRDVKHRLAASDNNPTTGHSDVLRTVKLALALTPHELQASLLWSAGRRTNAESPSQHHC